MYCLTQQLLLYESSIADLQHDFPWHEIHLLFARIFLLFIILQTALIMHISCPKIMHQFTAKNTK